MSPDAKFVKDLTDCQHWLRAFVRTLVWDADDADDVLQRTNLVLWEKADTFREGTSFTAWACQVARFEVMAFRKEHARDRHQFSSELVGVLAQDASEHVAIAEDLRDYLASCLEEKSPEQRKLLHARYANNESVQIIAEREGRTPAAVSTAIYRLRQSLMKCIRRRIDG